MCDSSQQPNAPASANEAMAMVVAGLSWLASTDVTALPAPVQADCLRAMERAKSVQQAAHARVLSAFEAGTGVQDDGCYSAKTWLAWQTRTTRATAGAAVQWMRRLRGHPVIADALAAAAISVSWARQICDWTDQLPADARDDADRILLAAAAGGASLNDLANLADQIRRHTARPDTDPPGSGPDEPSVYLATTIDGVGTLRGDLTPRCAAALQAVLDALGKPVGPEDMRSKGQRHHDALEEACRRLIASGGLPDRAGQPTRIQLHIDLKNFLGQHPGPGAVPEPRQPGPAATEGDCCDASMVPIVSGRVDHDLLSKLTAQLTSGQQPDTDAVRDLILANAVALLSGPGGLASMLRTGTLPPPAASVSLPLDVGASTDTIPPHLRRAVILRDQHCRGPGCQQPPAACQVHHLVPRSQGGSTCLENLGLYCIFHHLIVIHEWGWTATLNPDGTMTMRSPDGSREYHSHSPPTAA